jgi:hypothetical protein
LLVGANGSMCEVLLIITNKNEVISYWNFRANECHYL